MKGLESGALNEWPDPAPLEATIVLKSARNRPSCGLDVVFGHGRLIK